MGIYDFRTKISRASDTHECTSTYRTHLHAARGCGIVHTLRLALPVDPVARSRPPWPQCGNRKLVANSEVGILPVDGTYS